MLFSDRLHVVSVALVALFLVCWSLSTSQAQVLGPMIWQADPSPWIVEFGSEMKIVGDVDGDGWDDFIVGGPGSNMTFPAGRRATVLRSRR